jgi:hypothetical protein
VQVFEESGQRPRFEESEFFDAELLRWLSEQPPEAPSSS